MLLSFFLFPLGLVLVYFGADWLLKGAAGLVREYSVHPLVIGATVVAFGTSMPEFVFNLFAAVSREDGLALGNITGSNICNMALVLGTSGLVLPLVAVREVRTKGYPAMMLVLVVFYLTALDGTIGRVDGAALVGMLIVFIVLIARKGGYGVGAYASEAALAEAADSGESPGRKWIHLLLGAGALAGGSWAMVDAAVAMAALFGVSPAIVGLTVVAFGTSLPELATSVVGALKGQAELSIGNVLGSNILNVLFVVGPISLFHPLQVEAGLLTQQFPVMLAFGLALFPVFWFRERVGRREGALLLGGFFVWLAWSIMPYL